MPTNDEQLTRAQKQIQALFKRPGAPTDPFSDSFEGWSAEKRNEARSLDPAAYLWGLKYLVRVGVGGRQGDTDALRRRIDIYVATRPEGIQFQRLIKKLFPGIDIRVVVTGRFHALQVLGSAMTSL
jgi:hypothetical protein